MAIAVTTGTEKILAQTATDFQVLTALAFLSILRPHDLRPEI